MHRKAYSAVQSEQSKFVAFVGDVDPCTALAKPLFGGVRLDVERANVGQEHRDDPCRMFCSANLTQLTQEDLLDGRVTYHTGGAVSAHLVWELSKLLALGALGLGIRHLRFWKIPRQRRKS